MDTHHKAALALFALIGVVVVGIGGVEVWMQSGSEWEQTTGMVVKTEVEREIRPVDPQVYRRLQWSPRITYRYEVDGQSYTSDRMHAGIHAQDSRPTKGSAQIESDQYPVGSEVTVYYEADDPSVAALEVGAGGGWVLVVLGAGILAVGGVLGVRWSRA